jgi:mono/diheme cytochrome c family protein
MKRDRKVSAAVTATLLASATILLASCGTSEPPVYKSTPEREYLGSISYAKSDCASCHGAEWDGEGPDAGRMKSMGLAPTNFTATASAGKTPKDYFMAVTDPDGYFLGNKPEGVSESDLKSFASGHQYLTYTDKARWNIANFLYNLAPEPEDTAARKQALSDMENEVSAVYSENRRWEAGITPVSERVNRPALGDLIKKASFKVAKSESAPAEVSEARKAVGFEKSEGATLYNGECASCHGNFAEGKRIRYGLTGMTPIISGYPRVDEIKRQEAVFVTTPDLNKSSAMNSTEAFKSAHRASESMLAPVFTGFTSGEWGTLYEYTRRLAGK